MLSITKYSVGVPSLVFQCHYGLSFMLTGLMVSDLMISGIILSGFLLSGFMLSDQCLYAEWL